MSTSESFEHLQEIAVIGMACRFPGANNLAQFWENLSQGVESIQSFSDHELLQAGIAKQVLARPDYVKAGAVLEGIEEFDAQFFGMSPREAQMTDPQQRMFLEVAWEGLEDAGCDPQRYRGAIGVFAGASISTYLLFNIAPDVSIVGSGEHFPTLIGNDKDYLATHVSYKLNLRGPSLSIQTACSTSLVAIHMACQSLLNGECDIALAGGAAISIPQKTGYFYQEGAYFSPDGHCRSFSADARGTVFGSGVGVVVLKRLDDALRDGDCIDAVVKGSAINNDGAAKVGFTAPSVDGQAKAISEALSIAGVRPEEIGYVEGHGTATPLGDPIEVAALCLAFSSAPTVLPPGSIALGSVKSNVGHLDSAAGVAGFIKTVLSLKHRQLVPSLHCSHPNPDIDFARTPFYVNTALRHWPVSAGQRRRAGVSSFGIGGTNAHIVLEESPTARESHSHCLSLSMSESESMGESQSRSISESLSMSDSMSRSMSESRSQSRASTGSALSPDPALYLLPLSARHPQALLQLAHSYLSLLGSLTQTTPAASTALLRDLCYSASLRRSHHRPHRLAALASSPAQLQRLLSAFVSDQPSASLFSSPGASQRSPALSAPAPKVVFIFSGQGAQWWGMGRYLLSHSRLFRQTIEECDHLLRAHTGEWSLLEELLADEQSSRIDGEALEITQVCLFAVQVGLARLWQSYGVEPFAVIGHSMGEVAAAAVAGKLTLSEAVRVIYERSRLLQEVAGSGAMAAVELSGEEAGVLVRGKGGRVSVAAVNGRRASVISGEREAVQEMVRELEERGVMAREVRSGGVGGHSGEVERLREELKEALGGLQESEGRGERREREREEGERAGSEGGRAEQSEASRGEQSERGRGEQRGVVMISTVEVREVESEELGAGYWWRNMREGVRFGEAVREAARKGAGVYVEMNAHPVLGLWVREAAQEVAQEAGQEAGRGRGRGAGAGGEGGGGGECGAVVIGAMRRERGEREVLMEGLGEAYAAGVEVGWEEVWREAAGEAAGERAGGGAGERGEAGGADEAEGGAEERGARGEQQSGEQPREREERREAARGEQGGAKYVRLPGYAWQRQRFWIDAPKRGGRLQDRNRDEGETSVHPLLARRMQSSIYPHTHFWEIDLDTERLTYLQAHRLQETMILPASFYIEMALAATRELFGDEARALEEVLFENALVVREHQTRKLQLAISIDEEAEVSFKFSSVENKGVGKEASAWVSHASGKSRRVQTATASAAHQVFLPEEIQERAQEVVGGAQHYLELQERGLEYGPAFRCVQQVFRNGEESLGRLQLPEDIACSASDYIVHPALLDSGLQLLAAIRGAEEDAAGEGEIYLPVGVQRLRVNAPLLRAGVFWGYGLVRVLDESGDEMEGELYLLTEDGEIALEAQGIRARRLMTDPSGASDISDWFYQIEWRETTTERAALEEDLQAADDDARWLVLTDDGGFGDKLARLIKERGENAVLVSKGKQYSNVQGERFEIDPARPEHFRQLFKEAFADAGSSIRGVVHLWSLDFAQPDELTLETLQDARLLTCGSVLHLVQALVDFEQANAPRLWLLTRNSQAVEEGEQVGGLAHSALWGLGKVVAIEHDELKCTRVDLDSAAAASADETEVVWKEMLRDFDEEEIAFRHGNKFVSRLMRTAPSDTPQPFKVEDEAALSEAPFPIRSEATYLITGGLGGLGLSVAGWLVEQGARHLALMSRHDAGPEAQQIIDSLQEAGAQVTIARADVAQREQVAAALEEVERLSPPLAGVIHAAGVLDDGLLLTLDWARFENVTRPKIEGAWNLHTLVQNKFLDFFVMFSSAGSMLGSAGQGNHVAGNAFLDALAHYRRARGMKALSINWSQWSEIGKVAQSKRGGRLSAQGIQSLTPEQGLRALSLLLRHDATQAGVMKFDWQRWARFYPQAANASLLREVAGDQRPRQAAEEGQDGIRAVLQAEESAWRRRALLEEFLQKEAAWVLRLPPQDIAPGVHFSDLGLDSLRSLELRSRLEHALALKLPATLVWQFPTIETLAPHIAGKIGIRLVKDENGEPVADESDRRQQSLLAELARLSEEEAEALLYRKVETLHAIEPDSGSN